MNGKGIVLVATLAAIVACASVPAAGQACRVPDPKAFKELLERGYRSEHYQQDSLMLVDPAGDANLIRRLDTIPAKLFSFLWGRSLP